MSLFCPPLHGALYVPDLRASHAAVKAMPVGDLANMMFNNLKASSCQSV